MFDSILSFSLLLLLPLLLLRLLLLVPDGTKVYLVSRQQRRSFNSPEIQLNKEVLFALLHSHLN